MKIALIFLLLTSLFTSSCKSEKDPEKVLRSFISYRFESNQSKDKLLNMTTGYLKDSINSMDEEQFKSFVKRSSSAIKKKLSIRLKNCNPKKCYITYVLSYKTKTSQESIIDVKKIAELDNVEGSWKISDVSNIKSFIDMKNSLDVNDKKFDSVKKSQN